MTQPLIIDCDPGVDDATALLLALASPELEMLAITTVGGNVPVEKTARNAAMMARIAGRADVQVHAGADRPLRREPAGAGEFHGPEGLGDLEPRHVVVPRSDEHAVDAIVRLVMEREPGAVSMAVLGPLTNLALAIRREPEVARRLGPVAVMGGARSEGGNITASAEFNIWADPDAAQAVLDADVAVVMFGLDVTHQVRSTEARIQAVEAVGGYRAETTAAMLRFSQRIERQLVGWDAAPLHDPCPVAWLIRPELFTLTPCRIAVETESDLTRGHTAVEFREAVAGSLSHLWATGVDAQGVYDLITERLA